MTKILSLLFLLFSVSIVNAQSSQQLCYTSNGSNCIQAVASYKNIKIAVSSATTAEIIAAVSGKIIYISNWNVISSAAGTLKFVYGTGTNCATDPTDLTGAYTFGTSTVISVGNGIGSIITVPPGKALCITSASTINAQGSLSYSQF